MKRFLSAFLLIFLVASQTSCSLQAGSAETPAPAQTQAQNTPAETLIPSPSLTPEPEAYAPMDIFGSEFNPYADMELPDIFTVFAASFNKGSAKLEGRNPFTLYMTGSGNMYAAVAYQADIAGLSEKKKNDRFNDYSELGFCEFVGSDGRVVTIRQTQPHDEKHENGACLIEIAFDVPAADMEKYTDLIRDNYNMNALACVKECIDIETDFAECSIEVNLQNNETIVAVQYYVDDAESVQQYVADNLQSEWGDFYGIPSASIPYGLIRNTLVFDSRFGAAVLILQASNERNSPLGAYVEPEFSLSKFGFGFDHEGVCGVYEQHEPHYMSVAIHRPEWGEFTEDWNIEYLDQINEYGLRITYHVAEDKYHITVDKGGTDAAFDYLPVMKEYTGEHPNQGTVKQMFNGVFGTQGEDFYDKPLAYFEQLVQERFGMSIEELYTLPIK
jgi:hypothetical protein